MEQVGSLRASPFPLDGGRVGVGGVCAGFAENGDKGFDGASRGLTPDAGANTTPQTTPKPPPKHPQTTPQTTPQNTP